MKQTISNIFSPLLVHEYLTLSAEKYPNKTALIFKSIKYTYKQIDELSDLLAIQLIKLGVGRHSRIIIFGNNSPEIIISLYAVLKTGSTFVLLNGTLKAPKLRYIISDCLPKVIIYDFDLKHVVDNALESIIQKPNLFFFSDNAEKGSDSLSSYISLLEKKVTQKDFELLEKRKSSILDVDLACLIYTSGSTSEPKGVMSTHFNMLSAAKSIITYIRNTSDDIVINVLPLSFDYGLYQVIMTFMYSGTIVLENSMIFPVEILKKIQEEKVTGFPIVPTILAMLLKMESIGNFDLSSLRYISNTGAALPVEHIKSFRKLFPNVLVYSMFGLTECKRISYLPPEDIDRKPGSVGKAMPNCEVFILDENGNEVTPNTIGELVVRGSNVMRGYWNSLELTDKSYKNGKYQQEKWLFTGDYFYKDNEGYLYFVGRKDDMIKTKGERVSPKELENILCTLEGVSEAAVIGVPDEILGQAIKAFIVLKPNYNLDQNNILRFCKNNVELFMIPKYIEFIDSLPKTPNGKIDKKKLKEF